MDGYKTYNNVNRKLIADTMLEALGHTKRLNVMIGAKDFGYGVNSDDNVYITFKHMRSKISTTYFRMTLNASDLYDLEFIKIRKFEVTVVESASDVYVEDVREVFENITGLYLTL